MSVSADVIPAAFIEHIVSAEPAVVPAEPPAAAEFLVKLFATSKHREAALGDMNERFTRNSARLGQARATRLYRAEALRSILPLLSRAIGRVLKGAAWIALIKRSLLG